MTTQIPNNKISLYFLGKEYSAKIKPIKQELYFVCFMDMLGTTNHLYKHLDKKFVSELYAILNICNQIQQDKLEFLQIKTFSDNICFLSPCPEDKAKAEEDFKHFLIIISHFEVLMLLYTGEWVRGGITVGNAYVDDIFVWGEALAKAVEIEGNKKTKVPIIAIDHDSLKDFYRRNCDGLIIKRSEDTFPFLNFFAGLSESEVAIVLPKLFYKLQEKILNTELPMDYIPDPNKDKFAWVCGYYNAIARKFNRSDLQLSLTCEIGGVKREMFPEFFL